MSPQLIPRGGGSSPKLVAILVFILSCVVILHCGTLYAFSAYASKLKVLLESRHVAVIGSSGDTGIFLCVLVGYFYSYFGQFWTAVFGLIALAGGYLGAYWALSTTPSLGLMCVLFFFIGQGAFA